MAHLLRLTFALFLFFVSGSSFATIPTATQYRYTDPWVAATVSPWGTAQASCDYIGPLAAKDQNPYANPVTNKWRLSVTNCLILDASGATLATIQPATTIACPVNSTASGSACTCNTNYSQDSTGTSCVAGADPCASLAGKSAGTVQWYAGPVGAYPTKPSYSYCDAYQALGSGQCQATATKEICGSDGTQWICTGTSSYSGTKASTCTGDGSSTSAVSNLPKTSDGIAPSTPSTGTASVAPCPAGMQAGSVNGVRVCAPYGADVATAASSPDTGTKTVTNADGTKTTTATTGTTTCSGNVCTTTNTVTVTNTSAAGATTSTSTTSNGNSQSSTSFCQANGKSAQCAGQGDGKGGSFSGTCAGGFKADGDDAVLNAMAQEQFRLNCKVLAVDAAESVAVSALFDSVGATKSDNPNDKTVGISSASFDTSDALGGGSCSLDKTITVAHMTATLPFSVLCSPLAVLGQLLVAVSLLLAVRIVGRG